MLGQSSKSPQKSPPKKHKNSNKVFPRRGLAYLEEPDSQSEEGIKNSLG